MGYLGSLTPESVRDLWRTPKEVFDFYNRRFDFTGDVASSCENALVETFYTIEDDSLTQRWFARNWCNPPFSDVTPFVQKAIDEMENDKVTVMLLPADTSVKWFRLAFEHCTECHFISGRLSFINELTGKAQGGNNKGTVVFVFDPRSPLRQQVALIDRDQMFNKEK